VGRDGIMLPIRGDQKYREGATGTVSVLAKGKRLATMYLGRMPEKGQKTLTQQLTDLIVDVLRLRPGALPLLEYVADGGDEESAYFQQKLRRMADPQHPGRRLSWVRVLDFYHACEYISKLAAALFGETPEGTAWARKMRGWLRDKRRGIYRVLYSAAALFARYELSAQAERDYEKAMNYLSKRKKFMDYAGYRRRGLAIGSGITEAACKTVFTQRLKRSGMRWHKESGQVIVDLRILHLSGIWDEVVRRDLCSRQLPEKVSGPVQPKKTIKRAA